jgi:alpha-L-fucosidase 2
MINIIPFNLLIILFLFSGNSNVFGQIANLQQCNVIWDSPSRNSSGSMPLGNGDIGMNVWVEENGDLLFFISKTDSWSDAGRLLKLGQVRVRLTPALASRFFRQELQLQNGQITIQSGADGVVTKLRLWVDANRPVIHIQGESQKNMEGEVSLKIWRTADRVMQESDAALGVMNGGIPIIEKADAVLPQKEDKIVWYHRNEATTLPISMKLQGLESAMNLVHDPLIIRTFGGCISGIGLVQTVAGDATQRLKTKAPTRSLDVAIFILAAQTASIEQWEEKLNGIIAAEKTRSLSKAWAEHCNWWKAFWNRSWIYVQTPEDKTQASVAELATRLSEREDLQLIGKNGLHGATHILPTVSVEPAGQVVTRGYALQRFITAASGRGAYPIKNDGSIFTFNTRNPRSLQDADFRLHGPLYWFLDAATTTCGPMFRSGDFDLLKPLFSMYRAMVPMAKERTKLYYQHEGLFIPATVNTWGTFSNDDYGWNRGKLPLGQQNNIYIRWLWQGGIELSSMMLDYYEATQSKSFLRDTLMPIADGVVTFYDQHYKRDEKGKIRIDPACALESCHKVVNPMPELAGLRYVIPRLLALPADVTTSARRKGWAKTLADLPEVPMSGEGDKKVLAAAEVIYDRQGDEQPELYGVFPYRLHAIGTPGFEIGRRSVEKYVPEQINTVYPFEGKIGGWRLNSIQAAYVGKADQAARMVVSNFASVDSRCRFPAFWGPNQVWTPDISHGGVSMATLQAMLLQVEGKKIFLFPAWPKDWNVIFKLHALYNTTVEGELCNGTIKLIKITPESRAADVINMLEK